MDSNSTVKKINQSMKNLKSYLSEEWITDDIKDYSDLEIDDYINSGDYKDKAGAYSIQNKSYNLSRSFDGCYTSVVGLPLCDVTGMLIKEGFNLPRISCNKGLDNSNKLWI